MARIDTMIEKRARQALDILARNMSIVAAFLFGSYANGTADEWSDIDIAVFAEGVEEWDIRKRARAIAALQKEAGDDIELHFFPAASLKRFDPASFAAWVLANGIELSR